MNSAAWGAHAEPRRGGVCIKSWSSPSRERELHPGNRKHEQRHGGMKQLGCWGSGLYFSVIGVHGVWEEKVEVAHGRATETGKGFSTNTTHFYNPIPALSPHASLPPTLASPNISICWSFSGLSSGSFSFTLYFFLVHHSIHNIIQTSI